MFLQCKVNNVQGVLLGFVSVGSNNQPHAMVSTEKGVHNYPISEVVLDQPETFSLENTVKSSKKSKQ